MKALVTTLLTIMSVGQEWQVNFTPHPENKRIHITYVCEKSSFWAVNEFEIKPTDNHAYVHRLTTPEGVRCNVTALIIRYGEDPTKDYIGEVETVWWEEQ